MARGARLAFGIVFALAYVLLAPARAFASFPPICEVEPAVSMPPASDPGCELGPRADDAAIPPGIAPICDSSGASAIAPPPILPISNARIRPAPVCGSDAISVAVGRLPIRDVPLPTIGSGDLAVLPTPTIVQPAFYEMIASLPRVRHDGARAGHPPGVFHPPRAA